MDHHPELMRYIESLSRDRSRQSEAIRPGGSSVGTLHQVVTEEISIVCTFEDGAALKVVERVKGVSILGSHQEWREDTLHLVRFSSRGSIDQVAVFNIGHLGVALSTLLMDDGDPVKAAFIKSAQALGALQLHQFD